MKKQRYTTVLITAEIEVEEDLVTNFQEFRDFDKPVTDYLIGQSVKVKSGLFENSGFGSIISADIKQKKIPRKLERKN